MSGGLLIFVRHRGETYPVDADPCGTIGDLIRQIQEHIPGVGTCALTFQGQRLQRDELISDSGMSQEATVDMVPAREPAKWCPKLSHSVFNVEEGAKLMTLSRFSSYPLAVARPSLTAGDCATFKFTVIHRDGKDVRWIVGLMDPDTCTLDASHISGKGFIGFDDKLQFWKGNEDLRYDPSAVSDGEAGKAFLVAVGCEIELHVDMDADKMTWTMTHPDHPDQSALCQVQHAHLLQRSQKWQPCSILYGVGTKMTITDVQ
eukprot:TRINITY_DN2191_c0_g2_i1.p1 TRINITY_DN2191_c0_g2~~TRINITY_DN2191_c0_g2_i1.p1  ORF type:complete len:286 (+),score=45.69 TRINITY_DN2191_c0_g2_i1:79-858(+)